MIPVWEKIVKFFLSDGTRCRAHVCDIAWASHWNDGNELPGFSYTLVRLLGRFGNLAPVFIASKQSDHCLAEN